MLGILSIVICMPLGFFAWIMGKNDLQAMAEGRMDPSGRDLTVGGKICGIIGVILFVLGFLAFLLVVLLGGGIAALGLGGAAMQTTPDATVVPQQIIPLLIPR